MIISQDCVNCPPPQECLENWDPSPCSSCCVDVGPCTIYTHCGRSSNNTECNIFVACQNESTVSIIMADIPQDAPILPGGEIAFGSGLSADKEGCGEIKVGNAQWFNTTTNTFHDYNGNLVITVNSGGNTFQETLFFNCN